MMIFERRIKYFVKKKGPGKSKKNERSKHVEIPMQDRF